MLASMQIIYEADVRTVLVALIFDKIHSQVILQVVGIFLFFFFFFKCLGNSLFLGNFLIVFIIILLLSFLFFLGDPPVAWNF